MHFSTSGTGIIAEIAVEEFLAFTPTDQVFDEWSSSAGVKMRYSSVSMVVVN
jgi:hypothetical protein